MIIIIQLYIVANDDKVAPNCSQTASASQFAAKSMPNVISIVIIAIVLLLLAGVVIAIAII